MKTALKNAIIGFFITALISTVALAADDKKDPYEKFNRKVFAVNDTFDKYLLKPVAKGYKKVTPKVVNNGVSNMFDNVGDVPGSVNALLQGKLKTSATDASRFLINSTVGLLGFFDVATKMGLKEGKEDFGQTLEAWHVGSGPYIVWPLLGGRTIRDTASLGVDTYLNPVSYVDHVPTKNAIRVSDIVDKRADLLDAESLLNGDRYSLYKEAYFQRREFLIKDGEVIDTFGNEAFDDDIFDE